jgi:hypothetical protein
MAAGEDLRLLAYSVGLDRIRAVELDRNSRSEHDFGPSDALLDGFDAVQGELNSRSALSRPKLPKLERFAEEWGRELLPASWLSDPPQYGVLIPHALLHALPLHVVRTDSGRPLCAETGVSLCSSLTLLRRCLERSPREGADEVDAFVDAPTDGEQTSRWLVAGADVLGSNDDVWRELPAKLLAVCGEDVSASDLASPELSHREAVSEALSERAYELIIVAAHGHHDPLDALSAGLLLRKNERAFRVRPLEVLGRGEDEKGVPYLTQDLPFREPPPHLTPRLVAELLSLADLERASQIVCPLVALIGCSTGRAVLYPGDQPMSFAEVFLRIGAAAVVAPMWHVSASAVEEWMREFLLAYQVGGASRGEAARRASRSRDEAGAALHEAGCMVLRGDHRGRSRK